MSGFGGKTPGDGSSWLVKVPKQLADGWLSATVGADLGAVDDDGAGALRLRVPSGMPKAYELSRAEGAECRAFARVAPPPVKRAKVEVGGVSVTREAKPSDDPGPPPTGDVVGRPECTFALKPQQGKGYRKVCRARMVESYSSTRTTRIIEADDAPRADKAPVVAFRREAKEEEAGAAAAPKARRKMDAASLRSRLFAVFGRPRDVPYLTLKDVNGELGDDAQPEPHLKEALAELAVQVRVSGKIHYDLKPEYKDHT